MNEAEKHYSGQGGGTGKTGNGGTAGAGGSGSVLDQASSAARSAAETARSTASSAYGTASRTVSDAGRRSAAQIARHQRGVEGFVQENPVMVGVVGLAAGLLVGALLPTTRRENQVFGRYADEVREQGMRYARELAEQGKSLVEENLQAVSQGARGDRDTGDESRAS